MHLPKRKARWRKVLKATGYAVLLTTLGLAALLIYRFRDRSPDYHLDLVIRADPPPTNHVFKVGFGRANINPDIPNNPTPFWIAGFGQGRAATGNYDGIWAIANVIDDGRTRLAIVAIDAIGFFHDDVVSVRHLLRSSLKIDYCIVVSTHNHEVPDLMGLWGPKPWQSGVDQGYLRLVKLSIVQAVQKAVRGLQPATMELYEVPCPTDGLVNDTRPPKVFDPNIRMMLFRRTSGSKGVIGSVVGWANHPETLWSDNTEITADYVGHFRQALEKGVSIKGAEMMAGLGGIHLYVNGAIGGLMTPHATLKVHDPFLNQDFEKPSHEKARALGRQLAKRTIEHVRANPAAPSQPAIGLHARTLELPMANPMFYLAGALGVMQRGQSSFGNTRSEVAVVQLGDASIACIPGEIYPEIVNGGVEAPDGGDFKIKPVEVPPIRDLLPGKVKFIFGLANDEVGYILPQSQWDQKSPWTYGASHHHYGEVNSLGPETAPILHKAFLDLTRR